MSKPQAQQQQQDDAEDVLKLYCVDLTERAQQNKLDPVIGREAETRAITQTLLRKSKNNPVLIAQPGEQPRFPQRSFPISKFLF
jgi:ATP-dependent Clp protease ATP-binding subunit ClpB